MQAKHKVFLLSFCTVLLWASAFPLTKVVQEQFTSNPLGFLRCSIAAFFLIIIGKCSHIRIPAKKDIPYFILAGTMGLHRLYDLFQHRYSNTDLCNIQYHCGPHSHFDSNWLRKGLS